MDFVKSRLLDEEVKIRSRHGTGSNEVAFKSGPMTCFKCGKAGHKYAQCRQGNFKDRGVFRGSHRGFQGRDMNPNNEARTNNYLQAHTTKEEIAFIALNC